LSSKTKKLPEPERGKGRSNNVGFQQNSVGEKETGGKNRSKMGFVGGFNTAKVFREKTWKMKNRAKN